MSPRRRPALRGLITRLLAALFGVSVGAALVIGLQVPLLHQAASTRLTLAPIRVVPGSVAPISWPTVGSAALLIPSLGITQSWHNHVVPIASLAKMMTAYVTLEQLPLRAGQTGPCLTISAADVTRYDEMVATGQSSVKVAEGESLCEIDLLGGLLVHSANNFAELLATMVSGDQATFVDRMNRTALDLGLFHTHYEEPSGYQPGSVSTALEQGQLAMVLMRSPLVRSIALMTSITLPVAGTVGSFTPFIGTNHVIGVKSGRTDAAGGCDVMAVTFPQGASTQVLYAVILGQRGGNLLGPAGDAALALADSAVANQLHYVFTASRRVATIGWGAHRVSIGLAHGHDVVWWAAQRRLSVSMVTEHFTSTVRRGQFVGWLVVRGVTTHRFALVAQRTVAPPTLWQRLR